MRLFLTVTTTHNMLLTESSPSSNDMELVFRVREMRRFLEAECDRLIRETVNSNPPVTINSDDVVTKLSARILQVFGAEGNGWLDTFQAVDYGSSPPQASLEIPDLDLSNEARNLLNQ